MLDPISSGCALLRCDTFYGPVSFKFMHECLLICGNFPYHCVGMGKFRHASAGLLRGHCSNGSQHAAWHHEPLLSGVYLCTLQVIFHVTIQNKSLEFPSTVPEELSNIGAKCMSKDPAERPTMKDVVATLEKLEPKE